MHSWHKNLFIMSIAFNQSPLGHVLLGFRKEVLLVGFYSFIINMLQLAPTLYMLQVFDRVMSSQSQTTLIALSCIALFLFLVMAFTEWLRSALLVRSGIKLDALLGSQVFNASFEANLNQGDTDPMRAFGDLLRVRQFLTGNGIFAFFDAPWTPIFMGVLFLLHPWLGLAGCIAAVVQFGLAWFGYRHTVKPSELTNKASNDANAYLQSKLANAEVVEAMGMGPNLRSRWEELHLRYLLAGVAADQLSQKLGAYSKSIRYSQQSIVLGIGALLVINGDLTAGGMIAANLLMGRALAPIDMIVGSWRQFTGMRMAFARLDKLLKDVPEPKHHQAMTRPVGAVELQSVSVSVPGRINPILSDIDAYVAPGTVVAILGPSGSGKSTLARVILGLWPNAGGQVLLDGQPIQNWNAQDLGEYLGYLPQDIDLFEGTIAENIARFGELDSQKIISAAKAAGLHEMILQMPQGYNTPVGQAGGFLSGGQRQRIGLARAVFGSPSLIVLDEPNANLDDIGEESLARTVRQLKIEGKTVFLVTHRSGILSVADRVIVLHNGRIISDAVQNPVPSQVNVSVPDPA